MGPEGKTPKRRSPQSRRHRRQCARRRLSRRPAPDRHAGDGRSALRALGDLHVRAFVRRRDGHHRQSSGRQHRFSRACWCSSTSSRRPTRSSCRKTPRRMKVLKGGPVDTGRGFVLHSSDFFIEDATLQYRRRHLPDRDRRHPQGDRQGRRPEARDPGAGLCRLGAGPTRKRNPAQWLAALRRRSGSDLRRRRRGKIPARAAQDRHRSRHAVERSRARVDVRRHLPRLVPGDPSA